MIEIRHLIYYTTVVSEMHFTRAAKRLHIAQPALSQNIRHIEEEIGAELFTRQRNHELTLTPVGKVFYNEALRTLERHERMKESVRCAIRGENGSFSIGFTATTILGDLPRLLEKFKESYPDVELNTRELPIDTLVSRLRRGELDILCIDSPIIDTEMEMLPLPPLPMVVAINWKHKLAKQRSPIPLAKLANEVFILPTPYKDWTLYDMFAGACRDAGFEPNCKYYADSAVGGIGLVAANLAVDLMHMMPMIRCPKEVVWRQITPTIPLRMNLVWRKDSVTEATKNFIELVARSESTVPNVE